MAENSYRNRSGQTIMEMVVALSVLTVGFLGILTLINTSLGLNRVVSDNYRATYLAAEGIEIIKSLVATNEEKNIPFCAGIPEGTYELDYRARADTTTEYDCVTPYPGLTPIFMSDTPLRLHPDTNLYDYVQAGVSEPSNFYRRVKISYQTTLLNGERDKMVVESFVAWKDKTGDNEISLATYIFNSKPRLP
ncbi:MAG: hypothetical protein AAB903_02490 [Patescibacteria group bacterium]